MNILRVGAAVLAAAALMASTATAAQAETKDVQPTGTLVGVTTKELTAPQPDWYTDELHARVLAAAGSGDGVALPDGAAYPSSALAFTGIRPGGWIIAPGGCTTNFVFGSPGDYSIGTAGHCTDVGDEVTMVAAPGVLMNIGTTVRSVDNGIGDDFALIDVHPEMQHVNPWMSYFGGPTGSGDVGAGDVVLHAGHGLVLGSGGTPRAGLATFRGDGEHAGDAFAWLGAATPGDSGSAVRTLDGAAAGNLTHVVVGGPYLPGTVAGTSIDRMRQLAGKSLATAPSLPDPLDSAAG